MAKSMKPGGGGAFAKLEGKLAKKPGITNPGGLAAKIGREQYGSKQFGEMSARGKERATAEREGKKKPPLPKVHKLSGAEKAEERGESAKERKTEKSEGLSEALKSAASKVKK